MGEEQGGVKERSRIKEERNHWRRVRVRKSIESSTETGQDNGKVGRVQGGMKGGRREERERGIFGKG